MIPRRGIGWRVEVSNFLAAQRVGMQHVRLGKAGGVTAPIIGTIEVTRIRNAVNAV